MRSARKMATPPKIKMVEGLIENEDGARLGEFSSGDCSVVVSVLGKIASRVAVVPVEAVVPVVLVVAVEPVENEVVAVVPVEAVVIAVVAVVAPAIVEFQISTTFE